MVFYIIRLNFICLFFCVTNLVAQNEFLPLIVKNHFTKVKDCNSIEVKCLDTILTNTNNNWQSSHSSREYLGIRLKEKTYLYCKERIWSGSISETIIFDTIAYRNSKYGSIKTDPMLILSEFADCYYQFATDSFYFAEGDQFNLINNTCFEYTTSFIWEDIKNINSFRYYFDYHNNLKKVIYIQISGTDTTIRKTYYTSIKRSHLVDNMVFSKIKSRLNIAVKESKIKKVEKSELIKYKNNSSVFTNERIVIGNQSLSLDSIISKGKITILYEWFNGCLPCHEIAPHLDSIYLQYKDKGLNIVGLNNVNSRTYIDTCTKNYESYNYKKVLDEKLSINGSPTIIIFNNENKIIGKLIGYNLVSVQDLKNYISIIFK